VTTEANNRFSNRSEILTQWAGVLAGPLAWMFQQQISYLLVKFACKHGWHLPFHLVSLLALLLIAGGAFVAWRTWQQAGQEWPSGSGGALSRSRFMAVLGLLLSGLFFLLIVAQSIPSFILGPCQS
jgi:hypothetical protein